MFKVLKVLKTSTTALSSKGNLATRMDPDQVDLVGVAGFRAFRTLVPTVIMAKLLEEMMVGLFYQMCWFTAKVCCEGFTLNTYLPFLAFTGQLRGMTREWNGNVEGNLRYVIPQCKVRGAVLRNKCLGSMCFIGSDGTGVLWPWTWKGVEWKEVSYGLNHFRCA